MSELTCFHGTWLEHTTCSPCGYLDIDQDVSYGKVVENRKLLALLPNNAWILLKTRCFPRMYDGFGFWILLVLSAGEMGVQASWSPPKQSSDVRPLCPAYAGAT